MNGMPVVAVHGAPRSGTSWLGEIFKSSPHVAYRFQPLFSHAFKGRIGTGSSAEEIGSFFNDLLRTDDAFVLQRDPGIHPDGREAGTGGKRTHLVYKEVRYHHVLENLLARCPRVSLVAIIRDPRAVIDSWHHAPREYDPSWGLMTEWRNAPAKNMGKPEEFYGYERWKASALLFHRLRDVHPERVSLVRYATLNADPVREAGALFNRLGIEWSDHVERFIAESRSRDGGSAYSVFRKTRPDDAWRSRLPGRIAEDIEADLRGGPLEYILHDHH